MKKTISEAIKGLTKYGLLLIINVHDSLLVDYKQQNHPCQVQTSYTLQSLRYDLDKILHAMDHGCHSKVEG